MQLTALRTAADAEDVRLTNDRPGVGFGEEEK